MPTAQQSIQSLNNSSKANQLILPSKLGGILVVITAPGGSLFEEKDMPTCPGLSSGAYFG
eukprot:5062495-Prorocentrum_lima.AAC.1